MRIFNSPTGDPMLLDTRTGLRELQARFKAFVASPVDTASFAAETTGSPAPYDEFLGGLRVQKRSGETSLILAADRWLELSASLRDLESFGQKLTVVDDGGHNHWYCAPISLIIEADDLWPG